MNDYLAIFIILFALNWMQGLILLGTVLFGLLTKRYENIKIVYWLIVFTLVQALLFKVHCYIGAPCKVIDSVPGRVGFAIIFIYYFVNILTLFGIFRIKSLASR